MCELKRRPAIVFFLAATGLIVVVANALAAELESGNPSTQPGVDSPPVSHTHPFPDLVVTQVPKRGATNDLLSYSDSNALVGGSRVVLLTRDGQRWQVDNLTGSFETAVLGDVSFEAERLLIVGRRSPGELMGVWEIDLGTGTARQVVGSSYGCRSAIYLSTLYTMESAAPEPRIAFTAIERSGHTSALYGARFDGTDVRRLTFAPGDVTDPAILPDGRLLFCQHHVASDAEAVPSSVLMTVFPDGADLFPFAALHEPLALRAAPRVLQDGRVLYTEYHRMPTDIGHSLRGRLISVKAIRSLTTRRVLSSTREGFYRDAFLLPDGRLVSSYRPDGQTNSTFALTLLDDDTGRPSRQFFDDPAWHEIGARIVAPRPRPAGRSSVVDYNKTTGEIYCLDTHLTDRPALSQGATVRRVRVVASQEEPLTGETTIGEAAVERDGSFFVTLPARRPVRFETLDEGGHVVRRMTSWTWVMPGERRGCIGCHEDRELSPPNRQVQALRRAPESLTPPRGERGPRQPNEVGDP